MVVLIPAEPQSLVKNAIFDDFKIFEIHKKINFWLVLGVIGRSGSQEMSIFEVFGRLKIFENFRKKESRVDQRSGAQGSLGWGH